MESKPSYPRLRVIPLQQLRLHEGCDPRRVSTLRDKLRSSGVLRNPVVATESDACYIVLDGATRTQALLELGIPNIAVQLVAYERPAVRLERWHHALIGLEPVSLLEGLREVTGSLCHPCQPEELESFLEAGGSALGIWTHKAGTYRLENARDPEERVRLINHVVGLYRDRAEVHRTVEHDVHTLQSQFPQLSAAVLFPFFQPTDILHFALNNAKLPMGITRHVIVDRVLGLNVPLDLLAHSSSQEEIDRRLKNLMEARIRDHAVRHYEEPTWAFDDGL